MYVSLQWPEPDQLPLPSAVCTELFTHLLEAFESEEAAKQYWDGTPTVLVILEAEDGPDAISNETKERQNQITFALTYPEFIVPVTTHYRLALAIFTDEGSGIYLLIHNDCPLTKELAHA